MTNVVTEAREVLDKKQCKKVDGVLLDLQTANVIVTVADALSEENRARLEALSIEQAAAVCWKVVK